MNPFALALHRFVLRRVRRRAQIRSVIDGMAQRIAEVVCPPPAPRSALEFAYNFRIAENIEGEKGYRPHTHPAQHAILCAFSSRKFKSFVVTGPAQDGKTLAALVSSVLWILVELRRAVVIAAPDMRISNDLWSDKVLGTMRESGWGDLLPEKGSGSDSGTSPSLLLRTGGRVYRLTAGSRTQAGQAGRTAWAVVFTEYDDINPARASKLRQRSKAGGDDFFEVIEGTIKKSHNSQTLAAYERSTAGTIAIPCAACGEHWVPDWFEHVRMDDSSEAAAQESVRLYCPACGYAHTDPERQEQASKGVYVMDGQTVASDGSVQGEAPASLTWGIRWNGLQSPRRSMRRMASDYVVAKENEAAGNCDDIETFYQDDLALPYENKAQQLALREYDLARRSAASLHALREAPPLQVANFATCAIDVQHRSLYFMGCPAHSSTRSWGIADHGREPICMERETPSRQQVWEALDRVYDRLMDGWARPDGHLLRPAIGGVDVKDGTNPHRQTIIEWINAHPGMYALHGLGGKRTADSATGTAMLRLPGVLTVNRQHQARPPYDLLAINVDNVKGHVIRDLHRPMDEAGAAYLPQGEAADDWLIKELCAEILEQTDEGPKWIQKRRDNHRFDLATYNWALRAWWIASSATNPTATASDYAAAIANGNH